ncbi:hypothetical protein [uncultured Aquimarina sp.]|uniref:hypothetical protein n=1 Tax=uncultured Aquimarina sp. TaxID=575652 RepID=UPI00262528CD|nr:hypothetical protein [uncultured Aquimarina sp.]
MIKPSVFFLLVFVTTILSAQKNIDHKYAEFNFWIGEWNVYKHNTDTIVGKSKIEAIIDDKVIKETYHSTTSKYHGTSLNKYNPRTNQWEQFWVDNSGLTLHIQGNIKDGKMVLQNQVDTEKGTLSNKISWQKNPDNTVRQTWLQSTDKGKSWKVVFDGDYKSIISD